MLVGKGASTDSSSGMSSSLEELGESLGDALRSFKALWFTDTRALFRCCGLGQFIFMKPLREANIDLMR